MIKEALKYLVELGEKEEWKEVQRFSDKVVFFNRTTGEVKEVATPHRGFFFKAGSLDSLCDFASEVLHPNPCAILVSRDEVRCMALDYACDKQDIYYPLRHACWLSKTTFSGKPNAVARQMKMAFRGCEYDEEDVNKIGSVKFASHKEEGYSTGEADEAISKAARDRVTNMNSVPREFSVAGCVYPSTGIRVSRFTVSYSVTPVPSEGVIQVKVYDGDVDVAFEAAQREIADEISRKGFGKVYLGSSRP